MVPAPRPRFRDPLSCEQELLRGRRAAGRGQLGGVAGALDLSTPLPWAQQEAAQIPHAWLVVIPGSGHATQLASAGGPAAAQQFLLA